MIIRHTRSAKNTNMRLALAVLCLLSSCTVFNPPKVSLPPREGIVAGQQITVEGSQNIYAVARKYNVSMRDLIVLNNVQPPFLVHRGQKLILPAGYRDDAVANSSVPETMAPPQPASVGSVQSESLAPIHAQELAPISAPPPKPSSIPSAEVLTTPSPIKQVPTTAAPPPEQQIAAISPSHSKASQEAAPSSFVWPVQGPVLSGYGPKGQGLNNDGVNIGAPKGAPVVASANGIVVYAGNDMKGFGNLVLIRHQGGYVTAYAHLDRVLVNKDAVVAQGDEIGTVGKTGNVPAPQLHFETRYQGKPVDPNGVVKSQ